MPIHDFLRHGGPIFPPADAIVTRSPSAPALRVHVVLPGASSQGHESGVEEHDIQQPEVGYCHGEHEQEIDDQKRGCGAGAAGVAVEEVVDCARLGQQLLSEFITLFGESETV
jgi:hypothetical protein